MNHAGQLPGQNLLGLIQLGVLPAVHLVNLLQGQEGEQTDALHHVRVPHVAPVLVEVVRTGLVGVQPHGVARRLAHLIALGVGEQGDGHAVGVLAQLAADELRAAQHVGPLVVAAALHVAADGLEHVVEVVGLHNHIVELQEGQPPFHALLVAVRPEHVVHREAGAHLPQQLHVVQVEQPVGVVHHHRLALAEVNEPLHLPLEALGVVVDVLLGEHLAHVGAAGWVADHGGAAADQGDGGIARRLEPLHQGQGHEVPRRQAVRRTVEADIKFGLAVVDEVFYFFLTGHLGDEPAGRQFIVKRHNSFSFSYFGNRKPPVP